MLQKPKIILKSTKGYRTKIGKMKFELHLTAKIKYNLFKEVMLLEINFFDLPVCSVP